MANATLNNNGVPPITAPWPTKDVSKMKELPSIALTKLDCLRIDHGHCNDSGVLGVVPLACCLLVLSGEGVSKSRALEYSVACRGDDDWIHTPQVFR